VAEMCVVVGWMVYVSRLEGVLCWVARFRVLCLKVCGIGWILCDTGLGDVW
jgi:hypothetical protein